MQNAHFNPYGFIAPKTKQEYIALLDEALQMAEELDAMWSDAFAHARKCDGCAVA